MTFKQAGQPAARWAEGWGGGSLGSLGLPMRAPRVGAHVPLGELADGPVSQMESTVARSHTGQSGSGVLGQDHPLPFLGATYSSEPAGPGQAEVRSFQVSAQRHLEASPGACHPALPGEMTC